MASKPGTISVSRLFSRKCNQVRSAHVCHIATATSVLFTLRYSLSAPEDDQIFKELDTIHNYLQLSLVCHSIGNQVRPTLVNLTNIQALDDNGSSTSGRLFSPRVLLDLANLMQQCMDFSHKDLAKLVPAPWSRNSLFATLKRRLDTVHVTYVGDSALSDPETLELLQGQEGGEGNYVLCISMIHSARIMLEAVFIPVTVQTTSPFNVQAAPNAEKPASSRRLVYFPAAPHSFCCERLAACLRSARVLTSLCRSLMQNCDFTMVCASKLATSCLRMLANPPQSHPFWGTASTLPAWSS